MIRCVRTKEKGGSRSVDEGGGVKIEMEERESYKIFCTVCEPGRL